jgi:uracil-DNA glycosylase
VPIFCVCQIQVRSHPRTYGKTRNGIFVFESKGLEDLADEARDCKNCGLWQHASETVFGKGLPRATIALVGEQPGEEDVEGNPFVGPAGKLLDTLLVEAGIDRGQVYVTNAVKHFKWGA